MSIRPRPMCPRTKTLGCSARWTMRRRTIRPLLWGLGGWGGGDLQFLHYIPLLFNLEGKANRCDHVLINDIDTNAKCRRPVKGLCVACLSEFIDWRYSHSYWYFRPSFVSYCPLPFSLVQLFPLLPSLSEYTYTVCGGGGVCR
jgi:hypothetical protein